MTQLLRDLLHHLVVAILGVLFLHGSNLTSPVDSWDLVDWFRHLKHVKPTQIGEVMARGLNQQVSLYTTDFHSGRLGLV